MAKRVRLVRVAVPVILVFGVAIHVHRIHRVEACSACYTGRSVAAWVLAWPYAPGRPHCTLWSSTEEEPASVARRDLFDAQHEHRWESYAGSSESLLMSMHGHGRPPWNRFLCEYQIDDRFRAFVQGRIRDGSLSLEDARRLAAFERPPGVEGPDTPDGIPPGLPVGLPPEEKRLLLLGRTLFQDFYGERAADWWWNR